MLFCISCILTHNNHPLVLPVAAGHKALLRLYGQIGLGENSINAEVSIRTGGPDGVILSPRLGRILSEIEEEN